MDVFALRFYSLGFCSLGLGSHEVAISRESLRNFAAILFSRSMVMGDSRM